MELIGAHLEEDKAEREEQSAGETEAERPLFDAGAEGLPGGQQGAVQPHPAQKGPDEGDGADEHGTVEVAGEVGAFDLLQQPGAEAGFAKR